METTTLLVVLEREVGRTLHAPREAGRQELAERLSANAALSHEEALHALDALEAAELLGYIADATPPPDAMLEAARYGTLPPPDPNAGYWRIGPA